MQLQNESMKFIRPVSIPHLHKFGEREQNSNLMEGTYDSEELTRNYYPSQMSMNRFALPKYITQSPYIQSNGMPMPQIIAASSRFSI